VIAATSLDAINRMVWQDTEAAGLLCNVVGVPPLANFNLPRSCAAASWRWRSAP
jgi:siroheme synthase (precorrin-2 oxidase/ferrochelatase)